jgi:predicted pyridoxine 5'-phosphate oxidase superfamily flavin-nucleotide-binding protein
MFHDGELAVQRRAGVDGDAARLAGMLDPPDLRGGMSRFLSAQTFAALTARDASDRLWISPLVGPPGFLEVTGPTSLQIHSTLDVPADQQAGLIAVDFARRRRVRINGTLRPGTLLEADQAFGNCPRYIQAQLLVPAVADKTTAPTRQSGLAPEDTSLIRSADTFLLGTIHPSRGADASHRGGAPGFVRVIDDRTLWWPDYPGNNLFNSLGNLAADPAAALLFVDFHTGRTLQLSGEAVVEWIEPGSPGDDGGTGRRVVFTIAAVLAGPPLPVATRATVPSPYNPEVTGD